MVRATFSLETLSVVVAQNKMRRYNKSMNELRQKRKELGLTQIQAANACGVSRRTYQTYEETDIHNATCEYILNKFKEMGVVDGSNVVYNIRQIRNICKEVFSNYPEVECAYLFGSYARGEATQKSDIDMIVVCPASGFRFFGMINALEESFHKEVDVHTHHQLIRNEVLMEEVLKEGIKIYG